MTWLHFVLGSLATYRLALLFSKESGPGRIFKKLRNLPPPKSATKEALSCLYCQSVWFAIPVTCYFWWARAITLSEVPIYWLAFSAAAIALHHTFTEDFKKR